MFSLDICLWLYRTA